MNARTSARRMLRGRPWRVQPGSDDAPVPLDDLQWSEHRVCGLDSVQVTA